MSVADKDGRMLLSMQDRCACLSMSLNESLRDLQALADALIEGEA